MLTENWINGDGAGRVCDDHAIFNVKLLGFTALAGKRPLQSIGVTSTSQSRWSWRA